MTLVIQHLQEPLGTVPNFERLLKDDQLHISSTPSQEQINTAETVLQLSAPNMPIARLLQDA